MEISSSSLQMSASHEATERTETSESINFWRGEPQPTNTSSGGLPASGPASLENSAPVLLDDIVSLSRDSISAATSEVPEESDVQLSEQDTVRSMIIRALFKTIIGKEIRLFDPAEFQQMTNEASTSNIQQKVPATEGTTVDPGFGFEYDYSESRYEHERIRFETSGTITTKDGKTIHIDVALNMNREFYEQHSVSIRAGNAVRKIDPLVINYAGHAASLSETRFEFDLDNNGSVEQIALLNGGSAYLALDKNEDGKINNGSELFGPTSGSGFDELSTYDDDGNNFIDEGDDIYSKLRLWIKDAEGHDQLIALGAANVGAIYLGHIDTEFSFRDTQNNVLGELANTSIYLKEDGSAGTVQEINLVV